MKLYLSMILDMLMELNSAVSVSLCLIGVLRDIFYGIRGAFGSYILDCPDLAQTGKGKSCMVAHDYFLGGCGYDVCRPRF